MEDNEYQIKMIPTDLIRVVNPRKRDQRKYAEIVKSIKMLGLKTPIVVTPRKECGDGKFYDLVCGQGRLEAFITAGEIEIPARIMCASREKVMLMSLAENYARRQSDKASLLREVARLCSEGYTFGQIGRKLGYSESHICSLKSLIDGGNKNLNNSVLSGKIPLAVALQIVKCTKESEVQDLLNLLYGEKKIKLNELNTIKHVLAKTGKKRISDRKMTKEALVKEFEQTARKSRGFLAKVEVCDVTLAFLKGAFGKMLENDGFRVLLKSEGFSNVPVQLG